MSDDSVTHPDENTHKRRSSSCFSNLLKGKKVGCFTVTDRSVGQADSRRVDGTSEDSRLKSDDSIDEGTRSTNVALCCAITETSRSSAPFKAVDKCSSFHVQRDINGVTVSSPKKDINEQGTKPVMDPSGEANRYRSFGAQRLDTELPKLKAFNNTAPEGTILNAFSVLSVSTLETSAENKDCSGTTQRRVRSLSDLPTKKSSSADTSLGSSLESLIKECIVAARTINPVPVSKAKKRNFLHGRSGASALLGAKELDRVFPKREIRIYIATWNMNGEEPPNDLSELLLPEQIEILPDVYVIGTQESFSDTSEWEVLLQETIGPSHVLFHSETLGTLYLGVYIRRELIWYCSKPEDTSVSVRPGSAFKTKGAVALCFYLFGSSFLFITSHLTAHDHKIKERINDVKRIAKSLELPKDLPVRHRTKADVTQNFDYVFWFGDLNFRLIQPRKQVIDWLSKQKFPLESPLQSPLYDQLLSSMNKGLVFRGFQEAPLTFKPTYKYDPGTQNFDTHKQRVPSYTDRILYKAKKSSSVLLPLPSNTASVQCLMYSSSPSFTTSDHKPVWGLYKCKLRPGNDSIPLAAGLFKRDVYLDGLKRRARSRRSSSDSSVCCIQ